MFTFGVYFWCLLVVFTCGVYLWCLLLVFTFGIQCFQFAVNVDKSERSSSTSTRRPLFSASDVPN